MPSLPVVSGADTVRALERLGFESFASAAVTLSSVARRKAVLYPNIAN